MRSEWVAADLVTWSPPPQRYDLVVCLYLHVAESVPGMVRRLAAGVATGGPCSWSAAGPPARRPDDRGADARGRSGAGSVNTVVAALEPDRWEVVAEDRLREVAGSGVDRGARATARVTDLCAPAHGENPAPAPVHRAGMDAHAVP